MTGSGIVSPPNVRLPFPSGTTARRSDGSDAFNFNEIWRGPPVNRGITFISFVGAAEIPIPPISGPPAVAGRRKLANEIPRRRISNASTQPITPTPAKTKIDANKLPGSNLRETSPTCAGASAVAGADWPGAGAETFDSATGAFAAGAAGTGCDFDSVFAIAGACSRTCALAAGAFCAIGVSTTGEKFGAGEVGISSGRAGLPIANDPGAVPEDSLTALLAAPSSGFGAVASIPAMAGLVLPFAAAAPGIGLGSIAGLDSVCASASAVAASAAGAGEVASAGLC